MFVTIFFFLPGHQTKMNGNIVVDSVEKKFEFHLNEINTKLCPNIYEICVKNRKYVCRKDLSFSFSFIDDMSL